MKYYRISPLCSSLNFLKKNNFFNSLNTDKIFISFSIKDISATTIRTSTKVNEIFIKLLNTNLENVLEIKKYFEKNNDDFQDLKTKMSPNLLRLYNEAIKENNIKEKEKRKKISIQTYKYKFIELLERHFSHEFLNIINVSSTTEVTEKNLFFFNHLNVKDTLTRDLEGLSKHYATLIIKNIKEQFFRQVLDQSIIEIKKYNKNDINNKIQDDYILIKGGYNKNVSSKDFNSKYLDIKNGREGLFLIPKRHIKTITFLKPSENFFEYKNGFNIYMNEATEAVKNEKINYENTNDLDEKYIMFLVWGIQIEMKENAIVYKVELKE